MKAIVAIFTYFNILTKRIGICGNTGLIAGATTGTFLTFLDIVRTGLFFSDQEVLYASLLFTAFTWIVIVLMLCLLVRLTFSSVALGIFINCLITCFLTVYISNALTLFYLAWMLGIVVGVLVGVVLCRINRLFN